MDRQCGGLTMTALVAAARMGANAVYAGQLGTDERSEYVLHTMQQEGIDTSHVVLHPQAGPVHSTIVVGDGTRNIFPFHAAVEGAHTTLPEENLIVQADVLFVDHMGVEGQLRATTIARQRGIPVVADIENDSHPAIHQLIAQVDHLLLSEKFACKLTGKPTPQQAAQALMIPGRVLVAITCGEKGCWFLEATEPELRHQPAFVVDVVDTTGCGDVFHGVYAYTLLRPELTAAQRVRWASAAAALKATQSGGQHGIPTLAALQSFL